MADVEVLIATTDPEVPLPRYSHPGDAGADITTRVAVTLAPGERRTVPTGIRIALPHGYAAFVHPRSGLAAKHGVTVLNAPGTIDEDYRGEVKVILINLGAEDFTVRRGDRIAQMVIAPVTRGAFEEVDSLDDTARGTGGFGSTGA